MKEVMPYKLPKYITNIILPKCNMVYSEVVSSVYLQLLLNVNHQKNCKDWQKNKCWLQPNTISKKLGYNVRSIYKSINILSNLGLIKCSKKEKLNLYEVVNCDLVDINLIHKFNDSINAILISKNSDANVVKYISDIDKFIDNKYLWIKDILLLKESLLYAESLYKGSSLFFVQNFALININCKKSNGNYHIKNMSEEKMAFLCGSSQSTVSRYISAMENNDFLITKKNVVNKPMKIKLNIINKSEKENNEMENNKLTCPICNKTCIELKSLNLHIGRCKDEKHVLLNKLRKENLNTSVYDLFINNKADFDSIKETKQEEIKVNTREIVKYFYDKIESTCLNWPKECTQVKNLLKAGNSVYDVKLTMDYLAKQGNFDLRFLNRSVMDAKLFYTYLEDINNEGTEAYLVKYFYDKINLSINEQTLINDVRKIKQTLNSGSSYEEVKLILDYMAHVKCININFIGNMKTQALLKMSKLNAGNSNPCFNDRSELDLIKEKLINGNYNINKETDPNRKNKVINIARNIFKNNEYCNKYNPFEWAYKIGLELDKENYLLAKSRITPNYYVDEFLSKKSIPANKKVQLINFKDRLNNWIDNYNKMYC